VHEPVVGYVGRFAPSPTGPLHFGSLCAAAASFLHARQAGGEWLVRVEDVDPPREVPGAADDILRTLEAFDLDWDREVLFQSTRFDAYHAAAHALLERGAAFRCSCSRSAIREASDDGTLRYPGTCRDRRAHSEATAIRLRVEPGEQRFLDGVQGPIAHRLDAEMGDFVIMRRDGLPAYHLAVVIDDAVQGVTTVVRGVDLLESTPAHLYLQQVLGLPRPRYFHVPIAVNAAGHKLSKQTSAPAAQPRDTTVVRRVLAHLGLEAPPELDGERPRAAWQWAIERWQIEQLKGRPNRVAVMENSP
jgi:glutamyl-Q tRNA(Asp) synthetase